jgi:RimJ/RimL family protein N-acetyltransferase
MNALTSSRLFLRPISDSDNATLYRWRNEETFLRMFASKRAVVSESQFVEEQKRAFQSDRHIQYLIVLHQGHVVVGTLFTFSLNLTDGYVFLNTYIDERFRNRGYGPEASVLVSCYMFDFFPIHKVYYEAFSYNLPSLSMIRTAGLVQEGVFKGHRFCEGQRHDVHRFALHRDSLDHIRALEKRFKRRGRENSTIGKR